VREAREGPPVALWVIAGLLALVCAVGGIQVARVHDARAGEDARHERYAAALAAAEEEATAYVNIDHSSAEEDLARIASRATGPLKERYTEDADRIVRSLRRDQVVTEGAVLWTGVVRVDQSGATVLVATTGTRTDRRTDGPVDRNLRLSIRLERVGDAWLTSQIDQVD
jgi:Mce-associated membrane protein